MTIFSNPSRRAFLLAAIPVALAFTSCGDDDNKPDPQPVVEQGKVSFVNAASHIAPINLAFTVDNNQKGSADYGKSSGYVAVQSGSRPMQILAGNQIALTQPISIEKDKTYTFVATPAATSSAVGALLVPDDLTVPTTGKARIRVIHVGQGITTSIRLAAPTPVTGQGVIVNDVSANSASTFTDFNPGSYSLFISDNANVPLVQIGDGSGTGTATATKTYESGKLYTVLVSGTQGSLNQDQKLKAFVFQNN